MVVWFGFFSSFSSSKKIKIIYLIDDYDEYVPIGSSNGNASCRRCCCCYCLLMNFICKFFFFGNKLFTVVGFDEYFVDYDDDDCYLMIFVQNPYITHTHTYTPLHNKTSNRPIIVDVIEIINEYLMLIVYCMGPEMVKKKIPNKKHHTQKKH